MLEFSRIDLRQWQNWMDLNQNLWEEMKKKDLNTWIVIYAHKLFVSHLLLILSRPDEDRKKIPKLVKMKKMPIVLWFCAKKQNVGHLNIEWQRTDQKEKENKKGTCTWINYDFGCLKRKGKVLRSAWNVLFLSFLSEMVAQNPFLYLQFKRHSRYLT